MGILPHEILNFRYTRPFVSESILGAKHPLKGNLYRRAPGFRNMEEKNQPSAVSDVLRVKRCEHLVVLGSLMPVNAKQPNPGNSLDEGTHTIRIWF